MVPAVGKQYLRTSIVETNCFWQYMKNISYRVYSLKAKLIFDRLRDYVDFALDLATLKRAY